MYLEQGDIVIVLDRPVVVHLVSDYFFHFHFAAKKRMRMSPRHAQLYGPLGQIVQDFSPAKPCVRI